MADNDFKDLLYALAAVYSIGLVFFVLMMLVKTVVDALIPL